MAIGNYRRAVDAATRKQAKYGGEWCVIRSSVRSGYEVCEIKQAKLCGCQPLYVVRDRTSWPRPVTRN